MYGIFTYIYHKNQPNVNVGKYTNPMDGMGSFSQRQPFLSQPFVNRQVRDLSVQLEVGRRQQLMGEGGRYTLQGTNISHLQKRKNHLQNAIFWGIYVSFVEGIQCFFQVVQGVQLNFLTVVC